jgi:hypothetical protein
MMLEAIKLFMSSDETDELELDVVDHEYWVDALPVMELMLITNSLCAAELFGRSHASYAETPLPVGRTAPGRIRFVPQKSSMVSPSPVA